MPERSVDVKIRYLTDKAATSQLLHDQDRVADGYDEIAASADRTANAQRNMEVAGQRAVTAQRDALEKQIRLAKENADIYGDVGRRTMAFGGLASSLGGGALSSRLMIAADILDATEAAKMMKAEFPALIQQLGSSTPQLAQLSQKIGGLLSPTQLLVGGMGAAAVATAALTAVIVELKKRTDASLVSAKAWLNSQRDYFEAIASGNREELEGAIQSKKAQLDVAKAQLAETSDVYGKLKTQITEKLKIDPEAIIPSKLGPMVSDSFDTFNKTHDRVTELTQEVGDLEFSLVRLETALSDLDKQAQASADDVSSENRKRIERLRKDAFAEIDLRKEIEGLTGEQARALLEEAEARRAGLIKFQESLIEWQTILSNAGVDVSEFNDELANLGSEIPQLDGKIAHLRDVVIPAADANDELAKKAEGLQAFLKAVGEGLDRVKTAAQGAAQETLATANRLKAGAEIIAKAEYDRQQAVEETQAQIADSEMKYQTDRRAATEAFEQSRAEYQDDRKNADQQFYDELLDLNQEHQEAVADMEAAYQDQTRKDEKDFYRDRQRAAEDHQDRLHDAAASLDARAILAEQRQYTRDQRRAEEDFADQQHERQREYQSQLQTEQKAFRDRQRQTEQNYQTELRRLDKAQGQEQRRIQQAYDQRLTQMSTAHAQELARIQTAGQQKLAEIDRQSKAQLGQLFGFNTSEYSVRAQHYTALLEQLRSWGVAAQAVINGASLNLLMSRNTTRPTGSGVPEFAEGGYLPGGIVRSHAGEFALNRRTTRALERGFGGPLTQRGLQQWVYQTTTIGPTTMQNSFGDVGHKSWEQIGAYIDRRMQKNFKDMRR